MVFQMFFRGHKEKRNLFADRLLEKTNIKNNISYFYSINFNLINFNKNS